MNLLSQVLRLCLLLSPVCSANDVTIFPILSESTGCQWSAWRCRQDTKLQPACITYREKNCSTEPYEIDQLDAVREYIAAVSCSSATPAKQISRSRDCLSEPRYTMDASLDPQWCPWQDWQPWAYACVATVAEQHSWLAESLSNYSKNHGDAMWLQLRSRDCRCPNGRLEIECFGPGFQAAYAPRINESEALRLPTSRQSDWCPWTAWSGECYCLPNLSKPMFRQRSRVCRFGTSSKAPCRGGGDFDSVQCNCNGPSRSRQTDTKTIVLAIAVPAGALIILCSVFYFGRAKRQNQQQQQQQQQLLQVAVQQPVSPGPGDGPVSQPPPSYEEVSKQTV